MRFAPPNPICLPVLLAVALGSTAGAEAQPASRAPGGYGSIRLGMTEADAKTALAGVAHDVLLVKKTNLSGPDDANAYKFAVAVPWEDSYVGSLDAETKLQVGIGDGRVVTIFVRRTINGDNARCRREYVAGRARLDRTFGRFQSEDGNPDQDSEEVTSRFQGWKLYVSRYAPASSGWCSLATDIIGDDDAGVEARWRATGG